MQIPGRSASWVLPSTAHLQYPCRPGRETGGGKYVDGLDRARVTDHWHVLLVSSFRSKMMLNGSGLRFPSHSNIDIPAEMLVAVRGYLGFGAAPKCQVAVKSRSVSTSSELCVA